MNDRRTRDTTRGGIPPEDPSPDWIDQELASPEIKAIEDRLLDAREVEVAEAVTELASSEAQGIEDVQAQDFVNSLKKTWLADIRGDTECGPAPVLAVAPDVPGGKTALLPRSGVGHPSPADNRAAGKPWGERPIRRSAFPWPGSNLPGWPLAAAAAALLLFSWFGSRDSGRESGRDSVPDAPAYLGPDGGQGHVPVRGPSTRPEVLPETVDFSGEVPEHVTLRIEIHDVTKGDRLDDVVAFEEITYEPRWTCTESMRATLPPVMRFEVHREVEPPHAPPMVSRVYARQ